jgi:hypothetical protein
MSLYLIVLRILHVLLGLRLTVAGRWSAGLLAVATTAMAVARYL